MTLSYSGVNLCLPTPEIEEWIQENIDPRDLFHTAVGYWSGEVPADHLPWLIPAHEEGHTPLNSLYWPQGAYNWAWGCYLADDAQLAAIRATLTSYTAKNLVMSDGTTTLTIPMWMLPARPLAKIAGSNGLNLLTLVDDRYWWHSRNSGTNAIVASPGTTTWSQAFTQIESLLAVNPTLAIQYDTIPAAYLKPPDLAPDDNYNPLATILDRAAGDVGLRVIRQPAGQVELRNATTSLSRLATNLATYESKKIAGGNFGFTATTTPNDLNSLVPSNVTAVFPRVVSGSVLPHGTTSDYAYTMSLSSLSLTQYSGVTGNGATKIMRATTLANGSGAPSNAAELQALAIQAAKDWYLHALGSSDITYAGLCNWNMEGVSGAVEWKYDAKECTTRVWRGSWTEFGDSIETYGSYGSVEIVPLFAQRGLEVGQLVPGGTQYAILYVGSTGTLVSSPSFTYNDANSIVGGPGGSIGIGQTGFLILNDPIGSPEPVSITPNNFTITWQYDSLTDYTLYLKGAFHLNIKPNSPSSGGSHISLWSSDGAFQYLNSIKAAQTAYASGTSDFYLPWNDPTGGGGLVLWAYTDGQTEWLPITSTGAITTDSVYTATQPHQVTINTALTSTTVNVESWDVTSSGTPAAGFGTNLQFFGESTTTNTRNMGKIECSWATATDASRKSKLIFYVYSTTTARECLRMEAGASGPLLGFYGTAAAPQQSAGSSVATGLATLGLWAGNASVTLNANVSGQCGVTNGGTGLASINQGDLMYASAGNVISTLAKDTSSTRYLSNTGSSNNPAWAQVALTTGVSGVLPLANGGTATKVVSTQYDNNTATLGDVTGLSVALASSTTYHFEALLLCSNDVANGVQGAINYSGSVTSVRYFTEVIDDSGGPKTSSLIAVIGTGAGFTATTKTLVRITGSIVTSTSGNLTAQAAQNAHGNTNNTSILTNSSLRVWIAN